MKVFVTGSASRLAQVLLPQLCAHREIRSIKGVDVVSTPFKHAKLRTARLNMRSSHLPELLAGCDALIHLAFLVRPGRTAHSAMQTNNLEGSKYVFDSAKAAGIARLIHLSSAAVYGNGSNLDEHSTMQPLQGFWYAEQKAELESWLQQAHPDALRFRPHIILGPHAQPILKRILRLPFYLRLPDPQPLLQCIHEDDVARAIIKGLFGNVRGPINLAADDFFTARDVVKTHHPMSFGIPFPVAKNISQMVWLLTRRGEQPAWLEGAKKDLTLNCDRAKKLLGWNASRSSQEAIELTF